VLLLLVTAKVVPSSPILFTLMTEEIRSIATSVLRRVTLRHIPEEGILQTYHGLNISIMIAYIHTFICMKYNIQIKFHDFNKYTNGTSKML
jgi:hypothetical protein